MAIVLEECTAEEQLSVVHFLWAKTLSAKYILNEICPVYGGKYLSRKAVHNWVTDVSLMRKMLKRRCGSG
jgi:hypothetical protein